MKPGTAEPNVLRLINSTWLERQVPIYNISPCLTWRGMSASEHAALMTNTPDWAKQTGHQSEQGNKHTGTPALSPAAAHTSPQQGTEMNTGEEGDAG